MPVSRRRGTRFQSRTGFPGHLACGTHSIAQEATRYKCFREALYRRVFFGRKMEAIGPLFLLIRFWRLPRGYAQKLHHCASRKTVQFTRETARRRLAVVLPPFP